MTGRPDRWTRCCQAARDDGIAAGFDQLLAAFGGPQLPAGPGGHAVVPLSMTSPASPPPLVPPAAPAAHMLAAEGLAALRSRGEPQGPAAEVSSRDWLTGLAWLRLGLSDRLLGHGQDYLKERCTGGSPLIGQQMVKGDIADAMIEQMEVRAVLSGARGPALTAGDLRHLHRKITAADRTLLRLLGASGFLADGPGRQAFVSELLADIYAGTPAGQDGVSASAGGPGDGDG